MQILLLFLALIMLPGLTNAATFYAGQAGSDANSCTTAQSEVATDRKRTVLGVNGLKSCLTQPGDTGIVGDGIYTETFDRVWPSSGTETYPITLQAEHTGQATLNKSGTGTYFITFFGRNYITLKGFHITAGDGAFLYLSPDDGSLNRNIILEDLTISSFTTNGISIVSGIKGSFHTVRRVKTIGGSLGLYWRSPDSLIEHSEFTNHTSTNSGGAQVNANGGTYDTISRTVVRYNKFHSNAGFGLYVNYGTDQEVYGNESYNNAQKGFFLGGGQLRRILFYNNLAYSNGSQGIYASGNGNTGIVINNISLGNVGTQIQISSTGDYVLSHNVDTGDVSTMFVDALNKDFRLKLGSVAIDAGTPFISTEDDVQSNHSASVRTLVDFKGSSQDQGPNEYGMIGIYHK
jgi:hypothetical protein